MNTIRFVGIVESRIQDFLGFPYMSESVTWSSKLAKK